MSRLISALLKPPSRLRPIREQWARRLRVLWILLFSLAVLTDIAATFYALRSSYDVSPVFARLGLDYNVESSGRVSVGTLAEPGRAPPVPVTATLIAVDGQSVDPDMRITELAERLQAAPGPSVSITLRQPDGRKVELEQSRRQNFASSQQLDDRDYRMAARLVVALLACAALLGCSLLLALRRPNDPVAMLFAFAFVGMAATIDPPLQMWMWTGRSAVLDVLTSIWFYLLLIGLAVFPDGVFVPRFFRWLIPLGIALAVFVSVPGVDEDVQGLSGVAMLLALLVGQFGRFRRQPPGIERQQIKWAGFGFAAGLLLIGVALALASTIPDDPSQQVMLVNMSVLVLFSLGMACIPLGLLIALTRFRLWEADTVISRSAAYAVVTLIVGVVWAASSDLVKLVISEVMGRESEAGATTVGAIIAAGIFSPTQSAVLGWTRRHFGGPIDRIKGSAERLKSWGLAETPEEVATRALGIIDEAVHPSAAAVVLDTPQGAELVAAREVKSANDPKLVETLSLADEEGPVGTLRLGRRSDGNRYNRQELEAVRQIIPHLADALRVARGRHSRESILQQQIEAMAERLAQLEGGTPKPA